MGESKGLWKLDIQRRLTNSPWRNSKSQQNNVPFSPLKQQTLHSNAINAIENLNQCLHDFTCIEMTVSLKEEGMPFLWVNLQINWVEPLQEHPEVTNISSQLSLNSPN